MIVDDQHYDVIIVGTGAGGGTLARKLAPIGKKILVLERGEYQEKESSQLEDVDVFTKEQYHAPEQWFDRDGEPFSPQTNYGVGGNTKVYSGTLMRLREADFGKVLHKDGISPAWDLTYQDFEPYYTEAEKLYQVHGRLGDDPTEPPHSEEYPEPEVAHEYHVQAVVASVAKQGFHPAYLPIGLGNEGRTDSEDTGITPALKSDNVTLKIGARAVRLLTNASGSEIKAIEAKINNQSYLFFGNIFVLSCGAVNSAALLLRSANEAHPNGVANSSDQVGRNFMKQQLSVLVQLTSATIAGQFQRSVSVNDFYWKDDRGDNFLFPMGHIENAGGILQDVIFAESPPIFSFVARLLPEFGLRQLATRSIAWWLQTEDLPDPENRVRVKGEKTYLDYKINNFEAHDRLVYRWLDLLKVVEPDYPDLFRSGVHPRSDMPLSVVAHQCGTCRFGADPATSVLDLNCRAHEVDNLYVVDSSFFPSSSSISPALTVLANALRVGEHLLDRLG
ncbi:GMC family oxidoreductase [Microcoleus sp. FACHB-1515]|uniref:GMC oxidoreductase n=1 Tax=Cyanophyceae TaxID=3028117 RepID=UPI001686B489|nr:GMC family oxidoreductase [Microcoleus sp. FACHB-1515]MBD2091581.1 GMC family oxidoreductase [Microcoleus sp. FACHB-1515]